MGQGTTFVPTSAYFLFPAGFSPQSVAGLSRLKASKLSAFGTTKGRALTRCSSKMMDIAVIRELVPECSLIFEAVTKL